MNCIFYNLIFYENRMVLKMQWRIFIFMNFNRKFWRKNYNVKNILGHKEVILSGKKTDDQESHFNILGSKEAKSAKWQYLCTWNWKYSERRESIKKKTMTLSGKEVKNEYINVTVILILILIWLQIQIHISYYVYYKRPKVSLAIFRTSSALIPC